MNNQPLNNQGFKVTKSVGNSRRRTGIPWPLLGVTLVLHTVVGILLSVFSPPYWVWPIAFGGTFIQCFFLAGPIALSSFRGFRIILARAVTCLGTALSVVALGIAVGFGGTNDIDSIRFAETGIELFATNLGVLVLTAVCSLLIAYIGDRLLSEMGRFSSSLFILSFCFLGMFIGGALGVAIAS